MSEITMALGRQIQTLRKQRGWTQEHFAEKADLHVSYIIALEKGKKSASIDTLKKIANGFDIALPELFSFDSKEKTAEEYEAAALLQEYTTKLKDILKK